MAYNCSQEPRGIILLSFSGIIFNFFTDFEMQNHIEKTLYGGHASYKVLGIISQIINKA
jgi:hypothetical protein